MNILKNVKLFLNESLCEDVGNLFKSGTVLQIDDPIMDQSLDVVHVDLNVFGLLSM